MTGFVALVVAATVLLYLGQRNGNLILHGAGLLLILINAVLVGFAGRSICASTATCARAGGDAEG